MKFENCIAEKLVVKKTPDREMARSLYSLVDVRLKNISGISNATLKAEAYYEVIKELLTALLSLHGYKSYSHECLISFLAENYGKEFTQASTALIDQLRVIRNDISYRGVFVEDDYLERNDGKINETIVKLRKVVKDKIGEKVVKG